MATPDASASLPPILRLQILALSIIGALAVLAFVGAFALRLARGRDDPAARGLMRGGVVLGIVRAVLGALLPIVGV